MATVAEERLFGKSIKRREDPRFITGRGQYVDDVKLPGMTYAAFVRTPHERGVRHSGELDVIHVLAAPRDEARVLTALDRLPEEPFLGDGSHGVPSLLYGPMFGGPLDRIHDV